MKRIGFGQVEANHLSGQKTFQLYAQLPAADSIEVLENGQFAKYDYAKGVVDFEGAGEWMMVFNEVKLYEEIWRETYKDFAMIKSNYPAGGDITHYGVGPFEGQMIPRLIKTNVGDIFTTNCLAVGNTSGKVTVDMGDFVVGDIVSPNAYGYLAKNGDETIKFEVVKVYTLADGQPAVKLVRVK